MANNTDIFSPNKENFAHEAVRLNEIAMRHSKRAKWYSPCSSPLIMASSPESEFASLRLVHFAKTPRISFGQVKVGSSARERLLIQNPHKIPQTLEVDKLSSDKGFYLEADELKCNGHKQFINIDSDKEILISIKWEPNEAGSYREIIAFRWDASHRAQVIVFGTATAPMIKRKEKGKRLSVLQPSQKINQNKSVKHNLAPSKPSTTDPENVFFHNATPTIKLQEQHCTVNEQDFRRATFIVQKNKKKELSDHKEVKKATIKTVTQKKTVKEQQDVKFTDKCQQMNVSPKRKAEDNIKANPVKKSKKIGKISENNTIAKPQIKVTTQGAAVKPKKQVKLKVASKGVAQTKLKLVRAPQTSIPRHPLPFAAKNMYYDERWIDKQQRGFTSWLNFILTPPDDSDILVGGTASIDRGDIIVGTNIARKSQPLAPSREDLSLRAYTAKRKMARLRRSACLLYQSEPLICVIRKIEAEVEDGRLAIRSDKKLHADLGIKQSVVKMLLSYNSLWLRIGLEVVYGEILPVNSNNDTSGLCRFITERLLGNPDIAKEFAHPKVPGLYGQGYEEQLCKFTLKKLLLLVLFLDKAKLTRLIDHDPCLFNKKAPFKSSRSILLTFSRDYLKGEGDITKHLNLLGYTVTHCQTALDEYDFAVTNLAVDLRDGLRLTRVVELLTHNWKLSTNVRVPAISRLQKIHNVEVFMNELKTNGVLPSGTSGINPRDIVDGHREKTLSLLWQIIFNFQVNVLINEEHLKEEIAYLQKHKKVHSQLVAALKCENSEMLGLARDRRESMEQDVYFKSERLSLLLKWCKIVCSYYGMKVENFTVSFSDGRALCYILHHYHPSLIPLSMINEDTTLTRNPGTDETSDTEEDDAVMLGSWKACYSPGSGRNPVLEQLKGNERQNFYILGLKVQALGGVPMMAKVSDMSYTIPDEKVVITYVSYLCARLLDLREETRAARCIQVAWKRFRLKKQLCVRQEMVKAVSLLQAKAKVFIARCRFLAMRRATILIQKTYRGYRVRCQIQRFREAANVISNAYKAYKFGNKTRDEYLAFRSKVIQVQAVIRGKQARDLAKKMRSARLIQAVWKQFRARRYFQRLKFAVVVLQTHVRSFLEKKRYEKLRKATLVLQKQLRACLAGTQERKNFLDLKSKVTKLQATTRGNQCRALLCRRRAVKKIQSYIRMWLAKREYHKVKRAVVKIQTCVRGYQARKKYQQIKVSAVLIQDHYRAFRIGREQKEKYQRLGRSCIEIQTCFRGFLARKQYRRQLQCIIRIQAKIRQVLAQRKYQRLQSTVVVIQQLFRGYQQTKMAKKYFERVRQASVRIQTNFRRYQCQKDFTSKRFAAIAMQSRIRRCLARKKFLSLKSSVIVLQKYYRAWSHGRRQYLEYHITRVAVITLQAAARGMLQRKKLRQQNQSSLLIQAAYRGFVTRRKFQQIKKSVVVLQRWYRGLVQSRSAAAAYKKLRQSTVLLQSIFRGYQARKSYKRMKSAVKIQAMYRGYVARSQFLSSREAAVTIQAATRCYFKRKHFQKVKDATVVLQRRYHSMVLGRIQAAAYQQQRAAVITLQSTYRGYKARKLFKKLKAVVKIQSVYRGFCARAEYHKKREAIITLQATCRGYNAFKKYKNIQKATVVLQRKFRAKIQGRTQAVLYQKKRSAVLVLQSAYRGYTTRKHYKRVKAAVMIQSNYRGFVARSNYIATRLAVTKIQSIVKRIIAVRCYEAMKKAAQVFQQRYRALIKARVSFCSYQKTKHACLVLQAAFRGFKARKVFREIKAVVKIQSFYRGYVTRFRFLALKQSAVRIQASVRRYLAVKRYRELRWTAVICQQRYRARVQGNRDHLAYHVKRGACLKLQAAVRGLISRRRFKTKRAAAVVIQRRYRECMEGRRTRQYFYELKKAAVRLQAGIRGWQARRLARQHRAARVLQSHFRMHRTCRAYHKTRSAVIKIQSVVRITQARKRYLSLKKSATVIQSRYRAILLARKCYVHYHYTRGAIITMQAFARGYLQRQKVKQMNQSAIVVQAFFRRHLARQNYRLRRTAILTLQLHFRAFLLGRSVASNYKRLRRAVVCIQLAYRGYKAREYLRRLKASRYIQAWYRGNVGRSRFLKQKKAAILLQAAIRGYLVRTDLRNVLVAVHIIQRRFRAQQEMKYHRQRYLELTDAALTLQAAARCWAHRRRFKVLKRSALLIQRRYRATVATQKQTANYKLLKESCLRIQTVFRGWKARELRKRILAAVTLQKYFRMYLVRTRYRKIRSAAMKIQALMRMRRAERHYKQLRSSVRVIQRQYRAKRTYLAARQKFLGMKRGAVLIQSRWRGVTARRALQQLKSERAKQHHAALKIQHYFKSYQQMVRDYSDFHVTRDAVITIQAVFRSYLVRKFIKKLKAAILIQTFFRGMVARRRYFNTKTRVIGLQAIVRRNQACHRYRSMHKATLVLQQRYRANKYGQKIRKQYQRMMSAIILLQASFRCHQKRDAYNKLRKSTVIIQSFARMLKDRRNFCRMRSAATVIQRRYRALNLGRAVQRSYHCMRNATVKIQAFYRGWRVRRTIRRTKAAMVIQTYYRALIKSRSARENFQHTKMAAVTIQAFYRGWRVRRTKAAMVIQTYYCALIKSRSARENFQRTKMAAVTIQAFYRSWRVRHTIRRTKAAMVIQTYYRALIKSRSARENFQHTKMAAVTIQAFYRGWCVRRTKAAMVIQTYYRALIKSRSARGNFQHTKMAAVTIQAFYQGWKCRQMVRRIRAAHVIQAAIRGFLSRLRVERIKVERQSQLLRFTAAALFHLSAIRIQRYYRQACAVAQARQQINSVIFIQIWWRSALQRKRFLAHRQATVTLQRATRQYLQTRYSAAITLQQYARGWLARRYVRKMHKAALTIQALWRGYKVRKRVTRPDVKRARKRIASANSSATEPMKLCNRTRSALDYLLSCKNQTTILDALVSLEMVTRLSSVCCEDVARGGALRVIYTLMRKCNRSLPHMEIIKHSVCILINVSKCFTTYRAVYEEPDSITTLVELLSIFREKKSTIFTNTCYLLSLLVRHRRIRQDVLEMPKVRDTIRSIHNITERKYKMEAKKNQTKTKMALRQPLSFVPPTPCKYTPHKPRRDWRKWLQRVSMSQDPLQAVKCLLGTLDPQFQG